MKDFDDLVSDIKEIKADVKVITVTLEKNTHSLIEHVARTSVAERRLEHLESTHRWFIGLLFSSVAALIIKMLVH